jgi:hypothetical protein
VEEQRSAGGAERQVAKLVEDDKIGVGEPRRDLARFALKLLLFESVDEFDGGEEPYALAVMLDGLGQNDGSRPTLVFPPYLSGRVKHRTKLQIRVRAGIISRKK